MAAAMSHHSGEQVDAGQHPVGTVQLATKLEPLQAADDVPSTRDLWKIRGPGHRTTRDVCAPVSLNYVLNASTFFVKKKTVRRELNEVDWNIFFNQWDFLDIEVSVPSCWVFDKNGTCSRNPIKSQNRRTHMLLRRVWMPIPCTINWVSNFSLLLYIFQNPELYPGNFTSWHYDHDAYIC